MTRTTDTSMKCAAKYCRRDAVSYGVCRHHWTQADNETRAALINEHRRNLVELRKQQVQRLSRGHPDPDPDKSYLGGRWARFGS